MTDNDTVGPSAVLNFLFTNLIDFDVAEDFTVD